MLRIIPATAVLAACVLAAPAGAHADEPIPAVPAATAAPSILRDVLASAWEPTSTAASRGSTRTQASRRRAAAGPNIESVGLGGVGGLSEFELGPSFRYWATERFGLQAHLGFGGEDDFRRADVQFMRFEPTFIVAIGDFGNAALNVRPYAGGGIRLMRTDIGDFSDTDLRPAGVGGVEFGFQGVPRLKVSAELSISTDPDFEDFDFDDVPTPGGARLSALLHYFF
jgi:hypothetical protein